MQTGQWRFLLKNNKQVHEMTIIWVESHTSCALHLDTIYTTRKYYAIAAQVSECAQYDWYKLLFKDQLPISTGFRMTQDLRLRQSVGQSFCRKSKKKKHKVQNHKDTAIKKMKWPYNNSSLNNNTEEKSIKRILVKKW